MSKKVIVLNSKAESMKTMKKKKDSNDVVFFDFWEDNPADYFDLSKVKLPDKKISPVMTLARRMLHKLAQKEPQRKDTHWRHQDMDMLFVWLMKEVTELAEAYYKGTYVQMWDEAADVANMAMMLADASTYRQLYCPD